MYYVSMTDSFLSGWGEAENKTAKYVYVCENAQEAQIVAQNAKDRGDQQQVRMTAKKPAYDERKFLVQFKTKEDNPNWYVPGFFKKDEKEEEYNGWRNFESWNVALWITQEEPIYNMAKNFVQGYTGENVYKDFIKAHGFSSLRTPDKVRYISDKLDYAALNNMMLEL